MFKQIVFKLLTVGEKIFFFGTYPAEAMCLAIGYARLPVLNVAALKVQILMGVCGFSVKRGLQPVLQDRNCDVEEVDAGSGKFMREGNVWVDRVKLCNKAHETGFSVWPNQRRRQ